MNASVTRTIIATIAAAAGFSAPARAEEKKEQPVKTAPKHTNRLSKEKSPYLIQHQHNPVDWYPWGNEAFEKAKKENKPVFLSVGYSTCHWCHVMERESFENEEIAKVLNEHFICVKVDREERPDVDKIYMTFVQATTGRGGWPMSVWMTPDRKPFVGGTYFPPADSAGRPGFKTLLLRLAESWKKENKEITAHSEDVAKKLAEFAKGAPSKAEVSAKAALYGGLGQLVKMFDEKHGGFGDGEKFPQPSNFNFLLRMAIRTGLGATPESEKTDRERAKKLLLFTLTKMADGGIYDHLGGGFHRYSVDPLWHVPHYEKMLYDQAQIARAYTDAFALTGDARWQRVARETLDYVLRDMTDKSGGFYSAEDADSLASPDANEKGEGAFYVWTKAELDAALGADAEKFNAAYGVLPGGNSPAGSDPHGKLKGKNTLILRIPHAEDGAFAAARKKLFELRANRPRPHLDDKIITGWNGLMISAFARAAQVFDEPRYLAAAQSSARFIKANLWKNGALIRSFRQNASAAAGFADDYASLIAGLIDLYEADFDTQWLDWALQLQAKMDADFYDKEHGGYFQTPPNQADILFRSKEEHDGAEPAPSSLAALNLLKLSHLTDSKELRERAMKTIAGAGAKLDELPSAMTQMLCAVDASIGKGQTVVIAGKPGAPDTIALLKAVRSVFDPSRTVALADGGENQAWLAKRKSAVETMGLQNGKAAAFVCEGESCQLPETDPSKLLETLKKQTQ